MSEQGMKNLAKLYFEKVSRRLDEINERFIYTHSTPVLDVAIAELKGHLLRLKHES